MIIIHQRNDNDNYPFYGIHKQQRMNRFGRPSFVRSPYHLPSRRHARFHDAYAGHPMYSPYHYHRSHPRYYPSPMDELGAALAEGIMAPSVAPMYRYQPRNYISDPSMPVTFLHRHKDDQKANAAANGDKMATAAVASDHISPLDLKSKTKHGVKEENKEENLPSDATSKSIIRATQPATPDKDKRQGETSDGSKPSASVINTMGEDSENNKGLPADDSTAHVANKSEVTSKTNKDYIDPVELLLSLFNEPGIDRIYPKTHDDVKEDSQDRRQQATNAAQIQSHSPASSAAVDTNARNSNVDKPKAAPLARGNDVDPLDLLFGLIREPDANRSPQNSSQMYNDKKKNDQARSQQATDAARVHNKPPTAEESAATNTKADKAHDRDDITINVDVTGYNPDDLSVKYENRALIVSGEQTNKYGCHASFVRRVPLDERRVDVGRMSARLAHGVLSICVPRHRRVSAPRSIKIVNDSKVGAGDAASEALPASSISQSDEVAVNAADVDSSGVTPDDKFAETSKNDGNGNDAKDSDKTIKVADVPMVEKDDKAAHFQSKQEIEKEDNKDGGNVPSQIVNADHDDTRSVTSNASCSHKSSVSVRTVSSDDEDDEGEETFEVV